MQKNVSLGKNMTLSLESSFKLLTQALLEAFALGACMPYFVAVRLNPPKFSSPSPRGSMHNFSLGIWCSFNFRLNVLCRLRSIESVSPSSLLRVCIYSCSSWETLVLMQQDLDPSEMQTTCSHNSVPLALGLAQHGHSGSSFAGSLNIPSALWCGQNQCSNSASASVVPTQKLSHHAQGWCQRTRWLYYL